jgi:hypothetical protein
VITHRPPGLLLPHMAAAEQGESESRTRSLGRSATWVGGRQQLKGWSSRRRVDLAQHRCMWTVPEAAVSAAARRQGHRAQCRAMRLDDDGELLFGQ